MKKFMEIGNQDNIKYKLYTDASRRDYNGEKISVIAGYLLGYKNRPIVEFVLEIPNESNTEKLEMMALKNGLELAIKVGVKHLSCYTDNLNTVKIIKRLEVKEPELEKETGWNELISHFDYFKVEHIPREYNVYANALAKLPFNVRLKQDVLYAYHGVNRSKKRFYQKIKEAVTKDIYNFTAKSKASVHEKFKETQIKLELLSHQENVSNTELIRINQEFKKLYTYFHSVIHSVDSINENIVKEERPLSFKDYLLTTDINEEFWPLWLKERLSKKIDSPMIKM